MERLENNMAIVSGTIVSGFKYNHEVFGEKFYTFEMVARRTSGKLDVIPVMISERLINVNADFKGKYIIINGQFRSHNNDGRLLLNLFVRNIAFIDSAEIDTNDLFLTGYICKKPIYRKTPMDREIADVLLAVNRPYGKSDYIPCIFWGRNARFVEGLEVGTKLNLWGRIQSREYQKVLEQNTEFRTVYEVSVNRVSLLEVNCDEE
jgi:hypothetical protein